MKRLFTAFVFLCFLPGSLLAQILTAAPAEFTLDDKVTIVYNASLGNKALEGYKGDIYLHTGVKGAGTSDWKYVQGEWGTADPRLKMKELANNQFQFTFVPRDFYGIPKGEKAEQLAFVFRNAEGTIVGKDAEGSDLFLDVSQRVEEEIVLVEKNYQSHSMENNTLKVKTDQGDILITAYDKGITKVSLLTAEHQPSEDSYSVVMEPQEVPVQLVEKENYLLYNAPYLDVFVQKAPFQLKFLADGDTLVAEEAGFYEQNEIIGARFDLEPQEALYGTGSRALPFNRRGYDLKIYNEAHYGYTKGAPVLNVAVPFVVSSDGYGILFDNHYAGNLDAGATEADVLDFRFRGGAASYYLLAEDSYADLLDSYTNLTGKQPLPPLWAMGFIQSKYGYKDEKEAREIVDKLIADDFPIDALVLDLYWFGVEGDMGRLDWDYTKWTEPEEMMEELEELGVKTIVIAEPYFTKKSGNFEELAEKGLLVTNEAGEPYVIEDFWAGSAGLIDFTKPEAQDWMWEFYKDRIEEGVAGWWSDLGEPENHPVGMRHALGEPYEVHNIFSMLWAEFIYENYRRDFPDQRVFNLIRSGYAGMQRYATFPWSGDIQRSWSGLQTQIPIMLGMSMSGIAYMHSDLGGFTGGGLQPELYTRWLQFGAFVPIMRAHGAGGIPPEPVYYENPYKSIVRDYIKLRYSMLPYLYTMAWKFTEEGLPLAKPMNFYDADHPLLKNVNDQYYWGEEMIVAPVLSMGQLERTIILPDGYWINYWTNEVYRGNTSIDVEAPLERVPLFIKAGSFIPMIPSINSTSELIQDTLLLRYYPHKSNPVSDYTMYTDDGETPEPEEFQLLHFEGRINGTNAVIKLSKEGDDYEGAPEERFVQLQVVNIEDAPTGININGEALQMLGSREAVNKKAGAFFDAEENILFISFIWGEEPLEVEISQLTLGTKEAPLEGEEQGFNLHVPFTNPAAGSSGITLGYDLLKRGNYGIEVTDESGRVVFIKTLPQQIPGRYLIEWAGTDDRGASLPSGTYTVRLKSRDGIEAEELIIE